MNIRIKENSWIARIAAYKLGAANCAIVIGPNIHLYNATKEQLIHNTPWLRHEIAHVLQWKKHGFIPFITKYLLYSIRYGYSNNPFEIEARKAESDLDFLARINIDEKNIC